MPIACVLIPAFRLAVYRLTDPRVPFESPVLVADKLERGRVVDVSPAAAALGARAGMTLVQAQAAVRDAHVVVDDPVRDRTVWSEMLDALDAASPLVDDAGWGCAYLDMHGIEGDAGGLLAAVRGALAGFDVPLHVGLAANPFVARAAALTGDGTVVNDGAAAAFLAPLPLETLDLDPATLERLHVLGIRALGRLAALPHGPFVRRFGPAAAIWHERARGIDARPLEPRIRALRIERSLYGEGSATSEEAVLFALRTLLGRVVADAEAAGKRCGSLVLELECENGDVRPVATRIAQPTAQPATLFELLRARLEGVVLHSPVVGLRLAAGRLEDGGVQLGLFATHDPDPDALDIAIARLEAALGQDRALRARVLDGPRIERRFALEPFGPGTLRATAAPVLPAHATVQFRLISPVRIDVTLAGGIPHFVGSPPQTVLDAAGPWRVDEGWWGPATGGGAPLVRDEYDVLLEDGALLRIVRENGSWSIRGVYD